MLDMEMKKKLSQLGQLDSELDTMTEPATEFGKASWEIFVETLAPLSGVLGDVEGAPPPALLQAVIHMLKDASAADVIDYVPAMPANDEELDMLTSEIADAIGDRAFMRWVAQKQKQFAKQTPAIEEKGSPAESLDDKLTIQIMKRGK